MTDLVQTIGRVFLSVIFLVAGYNKLAAIAGFTGFLTRQGLPAPQLLAYAVGVFEVVAGLMILVGFKTRWAALALAIFTGIALYLGHKFWAVPPDQYTNQLNHALKNLAIIGGFLLLFVSGPGPYSVDARTGYR